MGVFIIAEAGVNHNGDIEVAKKLIDVAALSGVDAVKFQTWKTELLVTKDAEQAVYQTANTKNKDSQYNMLKKLELSKENFIDLKKHCDEMNVMFLSTPDEIQSANFLVELQDIFKIGSGELTNLPFLKHVGAFKKEIIISTGMGSLEEVGDAINILVKAGTDKNKITVLHANTEYPTPIEDVNLRAMTTIAETFNVNVGYSDHTLGIEVDIAAVALGAKVIEKHFTLDKTMDGPDHMASLEPPELEAMVKAIRNIEKSLGNGLKEPSNSEKKNIPIVRKSIVAKRNIMKNEVFSDENITTKRPGTGVSPMLWDEFIGQKAQKNYKVDDLI